MNRLIRVAHQSFPIPSTSTLRECPASPDSCRPRSSRIPECCPGRFNSTLPSRPTLKHGLKQTSKMINLPTIPSSSALGMLKSQSNHYLVTFLVGKKYKLMIDDQVTVPHIKDLKVGDLIKLTRITEVGSRNFTLRAIGNGTVGHAKQETSAPPSQRLSKSDQDDLAQDHDRVVCLKPEIPHYLDQDLVEATAIVVEHTRGRMITVIKKKRRKGYRKTIKNKPYYTRIRLCDIKIPNLQTDRTDPSTGLLHRQVDPQARF